MTRFRFRTGPGMPIEGAPIYTRSEHSLRFEPAHRDLFRERIAESGVTSVLVGRFQIEVTVDDGAALYIWGYQPVARWVAGRAIPHDPRPGAVMVNHDEPFVMGVSVGLAEVGEWRTVHDESSGWVRVTADLDSEDEQVVLIATDTCLGLIGDQLNSIWVRPTFET